MLYLVDAVCLFEHKIKNFFKDIIAVFFLGRVVGGA